MQLSDASAFCFKHRYLIVMRRENMDDQDRQNLAQLLNEMPELRPLRDFGDALQRLFAEDQRAHQAWCRWRALLACARYQSIPELQGALALLEEKKFAKMIAFLRSPLARRWAVRVYLEPN
jgi:hypothetical protein